MSVEQLAGGLITTGGSIGATAVISMKGEILYQSSNWRVDGAHTVNVYKNKEPSITIQGVKYSVIDVNEDRLIATNVGGRGHIVGAVIGSKALLIGYVAPNGDARTAYIEIDKTARQLAKIL